MARRPKPPTITEQVQALLDLLRQDDRPAKLVVANKQMTVRIEMGGKTTNRIGFFTASEDEEEDEDEE